MTSPFSAQQSYLSDPSWRNRLASFLLAAAVTVLLALLMLALGNYLPADHGQVSRLVAVDIPRESGAKAKQVKPAAKHMQAPAAAHALPQPQVVKQPVPVSPFLHLSHEEFAASDISKLPSHAEGSGKESSSSTYGPGEGPGGVHLFNAEWYREPSRAELATYLNQASGQGDWATIACKTIEHYHVENCQELDESPPGSGLARALRQAAWQFLVRPPRVDGHVLIGSWVRIRFTFTKPSVSEPTEALPGADEGH